ncbi:hypothetical protein MAR_010381 [Mya arenaria]|uniref:Uncharacterized protein n=1 Tax=Mya arenaria TaxID=6604 RepID=A0ABY7E1E1_MYAAR|nr:hypothetical protein MAR_010381 [Mya arenaria]
MKSPRLGVREVDVGITAVPHGPVEDAIEGRQIAEHISGRLKVCMELVQVVRTTSSCPRSPVIPARTR